MLFLQATLYRPVAGCVLPAVFDLFCVAAELNGAADGCAGNIRSAGARVVHITVFY